MKNIIFTLVISILTFSTFFAQEVKNKNEEDTQSGSIKTPYETQATNDKVEFKNETGNSILTITDEGNNKGSITLPAMSAAPSNISNKLYNDGGTLKFNGSSLGSGSGAGEINDLTDAKYDGSSLFLGTGAGANDDSTDNQNTAVGIGALNSNTSGRNNTANGFQALYSNTNGIRNTANGYKALNSNIGGVNNTANGYQALQSNITGGFNTANGTWALNSNTTGFSNTANGYQALFNNTTGGDNVGIGRLANYFNEEGSNNTIIGFEAGRGTALHSKSGNVFIGYQAGYNEIRDDRLYIENSSSDKPLIYGNFELDSVKVNGKFKVTEILSVGNSNETFGPNSATIGENNRTDGSQSIAVGKDNLAFGFQSAAFGLGTRAWSYLSTTIGRYNDATLYDPTIQVVWNETDPLFQIGNGTDDLNRSNALTVLKNGNTFINGNLKIIGNKVALGETANATGNNSFAIGSNVNADGNNSFAIGSNVTAKENGSFIISDASNLTIQTTIENSFNARFDGGYKFYTDDNIGFGAELPSGASSWSTISDSTKKENFLPVNGEEVLNKISQFNLRSWNYKGQDASKFRHYGPMAQEFYSAFGNDGIGTIGNDTTIASADFDGINLIAIQALEKRTKEQEIRIMELEKQNQELARSNLEFRNQNIQLRNINLELQNDIKQIKNIITEIKKEQNTTKIAELN